jgi:starvation-inducible outer membrane lipoprotein
MREFFFNYYTFSVCLKLCGGVSIPTSVTKENRPLDKYCEIHLQEKNTLLGD